LTDYPPHQARTDQPLRYLRNQGPVISEAPFVEKKPLDFEKMKKTIAILICLVAIATGCNRIAGMLAGDVPAPDTRTKVVIESISIQPKGDADQIDLSVKFNKPMTNPAYFSLHVLERPSKLIVKLDDPQVIPFKKSEREITFPDVSIPDHLSRVYVFGRVDRGGDSEGIWIDMENPTKPSTVP
jgi:hypothetical protein